MVKLTKVKGHRRKHLRLEKKTTRTLRKESTVKKKFKRTIDTGYSLLHLGGVCLDLFI